VTDLLEDFIAQGAKELRLRDKTLDKVLDMARKARILSKQAIHKIHMGDPSDSQKKLENAADLISQMDQFLKRYPELTRFDQVSASKEEFSEASILLSLYTDDTFPDPEVLGVPITSYLMGLGDVPGELRRQTLEALRIGDIDLAEAHLKKMEEIYLSLMTMEEGPLMKGYRRKLDIARGSIERTRSEVTAEVGRKRLEESVKTLSKKLE
jgi:translin